MQSACPVTVIVPTYNRADSLTRALYSVVNQTVRPFQIIVVDDGSTDHTAALIKEQFHDVVYIYQHNSGVSAARNTGIRHAFNHRQQDSLWIALLDSDDEWLPNKLERQLTAWQQQPQHRLIHNDEIWIRNGSRVNQMKKHRKFGGHIFQHCLPLCVISPSAVLLHSSLLEESGLFNESLPACEDYDLWLRICHREAVLYIDDRLIIKYGGHEDQLSRKHWGMDRFRVNALCYCIDNEDLSKADLHAATQMLLQKLDILIQGAEKRGNTIAAHKYTQLRHNYSHLTTTTT